MRISLLFLIAFPFVSLSQICNPNGNILIYSNYDGGDLNIDVDVDIPNLKIGVVSYEGANIVLSGTYVNNVTEVYYAGYNASNAHCGSVINTNISGEPVGATTNIDITPASTLSNPNGNSSIICAYSCDNNSNQGGCNTVDQIEDFFITQFNGTLYSHHTQYGCWSGNMLVSAGGNCCPAIPLDFSSTSINSNCNGDCDGQASVSPFGGLAPYTYLWSPGNETTNALTGLCANTYSCLITDANGDTISETFVISEPSPLNASFVDIHDDGTCNGQMTVTASGGTGNYSYQWDSAGGSGTASTATGLCSGVVCVTITDDNGCNEVFCDTVRSSASLNKFELNYHSVIFPNPSNGNLTVQILSDIDQSLVLSIYDTRGLMVEHKTVELKQGSNNIDVNLKTKGIYLLKLVNVDGELKSQIIVE